MFSNKRETNTTTLPAPISLTPAVGFHGNDGRWSTFTINVGNEDDSGRIGQNFNVLISTSSPLVQIPIQADWCRLPDEETCAANRGVLMYQARQHLGFQEELTQEWRFIGPHTLPPLPYFDGHPEQNLTASYGTVTVGLGPSSEDSIILSQQSVAGVNNRNFFMGSFGLSAQPVDMGGSLVQPFLFNLREANWTPSMSYGYTAGAHYQNNKRSVPASLVLGGYDHSRFTEAGVTIPIDPGASSLVVGVQAITYRPDESVDSNQYSLNHEAGGFLATIDSTFPYLWLPDDVVDRFEEHFQLQWDEENALYMVNQSAHNYNLQQNATVSFRIGRYGTSTNDFASIVLPYAAFDLEARYPLISNASASLRYFPIKRSNGQNVLGRAFLQEAYLVVDYEWNNFTVAPANFSDPMPASNIVPIYPKDSSAPVDATETQTTSNSSGLSGGAIAGAAVGGAIGFLLILLAAFFFWKKKRSRSQHVETIEKPPNYDKPFGVTEVKPDSYPPPELESNPPTSPQMSLSGVYVDRDNKGYVQYPAITEMESPPEPIAELESPDNGYFPQNGSPRGAHSEVVGYFDDRLKRRGATRESSGHTTPMLRAGSPEVPKDDAHLQSDEKSSEPVQQTSRSRGHSRATSEGAVLTPSIDALVSESTLRPSAPPSEVSDRTPRVSDAGNEPLDAVPETSERTPDAFDPTHASAESPTETIRAANSTSHARGPSDVTVESAISDLTPEQFEEYQREKGQPMRPLSE